MWAKDRGSGPSAVVDADPIPLLAMLVYTCANCQRELEIDDQLAGQRVRCPHCANVEVAPQPEPVAAPARRPPARAGAAHQSQGQPVAPAPPTPVPPPELERELARVHPVMFRARPVQGAGLLLLVAAGLGLAGAAWFSSAPAFTSYPWLAYVGLGLAAVGLGWIAVWKVQTLATTLIITTRRSTLHRGLLSRATSETRHDRIQDIHVTQTFPQRVMRVGTLGLDSSGSDQIEVVVHDVPDPVRLRELIDHHRPHSG